MTIDKPYKGEISGAEIVRYAPKGRSYMPETYGKNLGYIVIGFVSNHPVFRGIFERAGFRTSLVVKYNRKTGDLETLNSKYKVVD